MRDVPTTLHYSSGFPMVIGLHHVEDYKEIKVAAPTERMIFKHKDGLEVQGVGVTHGYHHYVIATRPRCMFNEQSFYWCADSKKAVGELEFEVGYKHWKTVPFELFLDGKTSPYPPPVSSHIPSPDHITHVEVARGPLGHPNRLIIHGSSGSIGLFLEPDLLHFIRVDDSDWPQCLDFRIEYIGISTGLKGQRDYADRLWKHEKVREIAGVLQRDAPNLQVYVFGYRASYIHEPFPGRFITNSLILESQIGYPHFAEVLEAALIGHFRPTFNDEFKEFPQGTPPKWMKTLKEIVRPAYQQERPALLSVVFASDNRHNSQGAWTFGRFYTAHTRSRNGPTDLCTIMIDLSAIRT
ncbi:hypothetical protein [Robbsia andropogonis]|uniref:hypothetical protein n=1 Tax=Robbsia andropogonis TaxID=28092 RepID=UPI00209F2DA4|nr:hypothetical protein [Robbsia andropogonis]MCP1121565.1 hypothetical protein [Robbsia andropogonis]MCP1131390.1 hypothetical protein [Robbsia andropogonis]